VCHGEDYDGGKVGVSCVACHRENEAACTACHGGIDNESGAPPLGLRGESATTSIGVGAHTSHLTGWLATDGIPCQSCHHVPIFIFDSLHLDTYTGQVYDTIAEIVWQGFADGGGAIWDRDNETCRNTYCHGNFPGGYAFNEPKWTGNFQAYCGSCHNVGNNPASLQWKHEYHAEVAGLECSDCHASVIDSMFNMVDRSLHINGVADILVGDTARCTPCHGSDPAGCVTCHGGQDNQTGAPPTGLRGETLTSDLSVGAHTRHLEAGIISDPIACTECHVVPTAFADPGHYDADSIAELQWGSLAGAASSWDRGSAECASTYCHGNFSGGYAGNTPVWTEAGQASCGSCHDIGISPLNLSGRHDDHVREEGIDCYRCHAATIDASGVLTDLSFHVNGVNDVDFSGPGFYTNGSCSGLGPGCHGVENWYEAAK
jgi:predicted CxxxxCH...CXXCH cytochrome family protein